MISGRSSETTYEQTENLNPGKISSVTAAPPSTCRRSSTSTLRPARARYAAHVSPLCPPPMTITSYFIDGPSYENPRGTEFFPVGCYWIGTRRLSSSNQLVTTLICRSVVAVSVDVRPDDDHAAISGDVVISRRELRVVKGPIGNFCRRADAQAAVACRVNRDAHDVSRRSAAKIK